MRLPAPLALAGFFQLGRDFGRELAGLVAASDPEPKKTLLCRILTEMAHSKVGGGYQQLSIYFQRAFGPTEKCREIREG